MSALSEPAAFDARKVLADGVDFADCRTAP